MGPMRPHTGFRLSGNSWHASERTSYAPPPPGTKEGHDRGAGRVSDGLNVSFPIAEASTRLRASFVGIGQLPTTILIDRRGTIRQRVVGLFAPTALAAGVRRLLGER